MGFGNGEPGAIAVRDAAPGDAEAVAAIYAPFVRDTAVSFETEPPPAAEMRRRMEDTLRAHPYLVAEREGAVIGYAYAGAFHRRAAYAPTVEVSAYVAPEAQGAGAGRALYEALLARLRLAGRHGAIAVIALPNAASVGFHERFGFRHVGTLREVGAKFGRWHDVGWWQLRLDDGPPPPC